MNLKITEQARKGIQSDVDALYRSEKYFNIKVERVDLYFPIIERILREEGVPEDFKYLVIQESSLISDAVSSSNAVGFWQFKKDAGEEVGLKINDNVDERMNIVSSTRGATTYLKKHNSYFDNWVYSLLAYYLGRGGAKSVADSKLYGSNSMVIDKNTNWYILKFLSHKVAFENAIGKNTNPPLILAEYNDGADKSLREISRETSIEIESLELYNKWIKKDRVPADKLYSVILPIIPNQNNELLADNDAGIRKNTVLPGERIGEVNSNSYPKIDGDISNLNEPLLVTLNGRPGIISRKEDNIASMAAYGGLKEERFRRINELGPGHKVKEGNFYYFKPKKRNAPVHYHTVNPSETLWEISQMYGVRQKSILRKNRMESTGSLRPGLVLWMRYIRPAKEPIVYRAVEKQESNKTTQSEMPKNSVSGEREKKSTFQAEQTSPKVGQPENGVDATTNEAQIVSESPAKIPEIVEKKAEVKADEPVGEVASPITDTTKVINQNKGTVQSGGNFEEKAPIQEDTLEEDAFHGNNVTFIEDKSTEVIKNDTHIVQQGETLYGLSKKYNVPLQELAAWNKLKYNDPIKIGQSILVNSPPNVTNKVAPDVIKTPEKVAEKFILYKVVAGETLYKIARDHNVTIKEVMEWNDKTDFKVSSGEVIKIKKAIGNE
ncbi:MAG: LysM peptidoglycan-binding domain-containing protein [Bacteroidota bacterium]|nr:LysM peptidoglycan-binding domain-containing protein [Bacteroidota bacterium]